MRGRVTFVLYALFLALAVGGPVATFGRPVPEAAGGVIGTQANKEVSVDALAQDNFYTGRVLSAESATISLPYVTQSVPMVPMAKVGMT